MVSSEQSRWSLFLSEVDEVQDIPKCTAIETKLCAAGWPNPLSIVGADPAELVDSLEGLSAPDRAFVRRALKEAEKQAARRDADSLAAALPAQTDANQAAMVPASQPANTQPELLQTLQSLMGT